MGISFLIPVIAEHDSSYKSGARKSSDATQGVGARLIFPRQKSAMAGVGRRSGHDHVPSRRW